MSKLLICIFILLLTNLHSQEITFNINAEYTKFDSADLNFLIETYNTSLTGQFPFLSNGWGGSCELGVEIMEEFILATAKFSYLFSSTGKRIMYSEEEYPILKQEQEKKSYLVGFPNKLTLNLLSPLLGLKIIPYNSEKVTLGGMFSIGFGYSSLVFDATYIYKEYDEVNDQYYYYSYNYSHPYAANAPIYEISGSLEYRPYGFYTSKYIKEKSDDPLPLLRSLSIELTFGYRIADLGVLKATQDIDTDDDGVVDIKRNDPLTISGREIKSNLSSLFINLGLKFRW